MKSSAAGARGAPARQRFLEGRWPEILILLVAAVLRLSWLELRPPHHDEGADGWQAMQITWEAGYAFHAGHGHGPLHFYLLWVAQRLGGHSLTVLRLPDALFSIGAVALTLGFGRLLGRNAARWAGVAMALSPAFTYYGRDAIHESELVFFLLLGLWGVLGLWTDGRLRYFWAAMLGAIGCLLTKETAWLHFAAFFAAAFVLLWQEELGSSADPAAGIKPVGSLIHPPSSWMLLLAIVSSIALLALFYTGHGTRPAGIMEFLAAPFAWLEKGGAGGHEKPWSYWSNLVLRHEWPCLIGLAAAPFLIPRKSRSIRFLGIGTLLTLAAYTLIPYKTPWCLISILAAAPLLFGAVMSSAHSPLFRALLPVVAVVALGGSAMQNIRLNFFSFADPRESYAYVQTPPDIWKLAAAFDALRRHDPHARSTRGKVFLTEPHPIPWLLHDFPYVSWFAPLDRPKYYDSGFLIVEAARLAEVEAALHMEYQRFPLKLLPDESAAVLYLRRDIFR